MAIFDPVHAEWRGRTFTLPADRILVCLAAMEDVLTLSQLYQCTVSGDLPLAKLARAYGILLRHAGAPVTDEEVYEALFTKDEFKGRVMQIVSALQILMLPPSTWKGAKGDAAKKVGAQQPKNASSRKRTK